MGQVGSTMDWAVTLHHGLHGYSTLLNHTILRKTFNKLPYRTIKPPPTQLQDALLRHLTTAFPQSGTRTLLIDKNSSTVNLQLLHLEETTKHLIPPLLRQIWPLEASLLSTGLKFLHQTQNSLHTIVDAGTL